VSGSSRYLEIEPLAWILALETLVLTDEADAGGLKIKLLQVHCAPSRRF